MSDKLHDATPEIAALKRQVAELTASIAGADAVIDVNKVIARVVRRNNLPPEVLYVQHARKAAVTRSATAARGDNDGYYLDQIKGNPTMAQFLEQKTEIRVQLAKERAEYDGKHPGDEQRPQPTSEYPRRDENRPRTLARRPDERYSRPYDNNQRGSYGSRGGFRGRRGRGRSVHFGNRRGVHVTGTVEDERENEVTSTLQHQSDPEQESERRQPAWL